MAKRTTPVLPLSGVRKVLTVVPVPKSKMRDHAERVSILTQAATVKQLQGVLAADRAA